MRKKLLKLSMALLCCVSATTWAQQHVNTTFYDQQVQMFKSLDITKVPTGILYEHSFPFNELSAFDGEIRDSLYVDGGTVKDMYKTIYTGVIDVNNRTCFQK